MVKREGTQVASSQGGAGRKHLIPERLHCYFHNRIGLFQFLIDSAACGTGIFLT
jgi:hypothetical protein